MTDDERTEQNSTEDVPSEEPQPEAEDVFDEAPEGAEGPPPDTDVFDMLRAAAGLFTQEAWIALGLQPRYGSGEAQMDLRCAKVAIDTTQFLV
ncbi:MAG: hypothetical protein ACOCZ7_04515, partial [Armatimonadota bacterium]